MFLTLLTMVCSLASSVVSGDVAVAERLASKTAYDLYLSGNALCHEGDYRGAVSSFRQSIDREPGYHYAHANLGFALAKLQRCAEAIEEFTFCIDAGHGSGADRVVFHFNRARAYRQDGQLEAAKRDQAALEKLDPARAEMLQDTHDYVLMDAVYVEARNNAAKSRLFEEREAEIAKGKIVVRKVPGAGANSQEFEAMGLVEGTLEQVSTVLADYAKYPEFMPNIKETSIKSSRDDEVVVDWQLQLPMGYVKKYRLKCWGKQEGNRVQRFWKQLAWPGLKPEETIADTYGQWILEAFPGDEPQVLAYYRVYTDPGKVPLGTGWIVDLLSQRSVPDIITRTRKRVKGLFY